MDSIASGREGGARETPTAEFELAGRYRVIRRLGSGGAATVFLAQDEHLDRRVAIKRMHTGSPDDAAARFAREARVGAALNHPHLVTIFDTIADEESVLIVMEYVEGTDLSDAIRSGAMHREAALDVLEAVAGALDYAHGQGVVHRDVKPSNVLVRGDGVVKLADLGIAKAIEDTDITHSGAVIGTLLYMSPEQLAGREVTASSDLYSLALIAFELLAGQRAREPGPPAAIDRQAQTPPDLSDSNPDAPRAAVEILRRALDPDPERRPLSASGFVADLRAALSGRPVRTEAGRAAAAVPETERATPPTPPPAEGPPVDEPATGELAPLPEPHRRSRAPLAVAALLALLVAGGAIAALSGGSGGSDKANSAKTAQARSGPSGQSGSGSGGGGGSAAAAAPATSGSSQTQQSSQPAPPAAASTPAPGDPGATVQQVYQRAAAGDVGGAWALTTDPYRTEVGGYSGFVSQSSDLESVTFTKLDTTSQTADSATVEFADVARHTTKTDHCSGSFGLVYSGGQWLLSDAQSIVCG